MSNMTSESDDRIGSMDGINSAMPDEVSTERSMVGSGSLKKGPWTSAEDAILMDYVNKHGEGNWNAVQKHSGLSRCGKSCRLRWANHLRPDLKKGAFTPDEERRIIELHAKMGNKWARMAVELPGRTDNEIKNFWNTRTKRRQRANLPIYPPDVCLQSLNDNAQSQNMLTFANEDPSPSEILPTNNFLIPAVEFKNLELNHELYARSLRDIPGSSFFDIPGGSLLPHGPGSTSNNNNSFVFPLPPPKKRFRRSDTYPVFDNGDGDALNDLFPLVNLYQDDKFTQSFELSSSYNQNINGDIPSHGQSVGSHAFINGNPSSSELISWATKMELPSLQYATQVGSCGAPSSPLPSLESVDTLIQTPLIGQTKSNPPSRRNSGLLEEVLYESQTLKMSKSNNNSNASGLPRDITESSSRTDWEGDGDPMSPFGQSSASVFSEYTPHISGSPPDDHQSIEGISVKHEAEESGPKQSDQEEDKSNRIDFSRPDYLLGSNWFPSASIVDTWVSDPICPLLGNDFCSDLDHISTSSFYNEPGIGDISEICRTSGNH